MPNSEATVSVLDLELKKWVRHLSSKLAIWVLAPLERGYFQLQTGLQCALPFFITFNRLDMTELVLKCPLTASHTSPVLRIDNQQNFRIMKILILLKSFISLFYIIRYILRSML